MKPNGELIKFLLAAKRATYAGKGAEETVSSRPSSHDLRYAKEGIFAKSVKIYECLFHGGFVR